MATATVPWPQKTRELQNALFDSTRWVDFKFRDDDVIVATWGKSGTTWTQQIVSQLIFRGAEGIAVMEGISPWLDLRVFPLQEITDKLEAQTHRRVIKTHLPLKALVFSPKARYIYIARDGRDVAWSWHNHLISMTNEVWDMINNVPGRVGPLAVPPTADIIEYFREWIESDGFPLSNFWEHTQSWFNARHVPNLLLLHYNNLKANLPGQMRRIAKFLDIEIEEELWPTLVEHCTFDYMRQNASKIAPVVDVFFKQGGNDFIYKGLNGRWKDMLTAEDLEKYEQVVRKKLTPECAHWLETGEA
jgi:aryl sulfotransferase